jgi:hypothetical protein
VYTPTFDFHVDTLRFMGNTELFINSKEPKQSVSETGRCGLGGFTSASIGLTTQVLTDVNFRVKKTYVPSSVSITADASNKTPGITNITIDGFTMFLEKGTSDAVYYWRGTYTA